MAGLEFKYPWLLLLLVPYAAFTVFYWIKGWNRRESVIGVSSRGLIRGKKTMRARLYPYLPALRFAAIFLLILALARPGKGVDSSSVKNYGIDIMIALDVSQSMRGEDFEPKNRLTVAKDVLKSFIALRPGDRIGMVIFSGEAYLQCPLSAEHDLLTDLTDEIDFDSVSEDGTAIGDALALCASRMDSPESKGKLILLVTDGVNNRGVIDPGTAAGICADAGIKIYAVGIGKDGPVPYPVQGPFGMVQRRNILNQFDEKAVKELAEATDGAFFRAQSSGVLWDNIKEIDRMEKSEFQVRTYHEFFDRFQRLIFAAGILFMLEILLRALVFRKVP
ncbi:MAG: vWA domain-containing protein [Spirochaetota bacterium]